MPPRKMTGPEQRELVTAIAEAFTPALEKVFAAAENGDSAAVREQSVHATKQLLTSLTKGGWQKTWQVTDAAQARTLPANALVLDAVGDAARVHIMDGRRMFELLGTETEDDVDCVGYPLTVVRNTDPENWPAQQ